ncbi:fumarylacetoacetate hydrolase family protein [Amnibacterium flavum]|uniref:2-hydroxyhepta-2,4-diene-1,7-dioate isomerase n=1 Tax=Amnibacterium flavum TaxID=2173173 RepID=A0A2V1HRL0_9MICO|nr:fumarylacetoacetate hydrolase family protein [Amnibacterium flavum]PVZ95243.1 2-hydroxyhepta-2,4-diene-1,7-dioate isomerase [Amnibacterium flavum]
MPYLSYVRDGEPHIGAITADGIDEFEGISALTPDHDLDHLTRALHGSRIDRASTSPLPASPRAQKILCVGLNYDEHILETGREKPTYPVFFAKFASNLIADGDPILLPRESDQVDFEGELAVIVGRRGRRISEQDALEHVLGYSVANDVTMRDFQYKTHQWIQGKAWDRSTPLGDVIVPPAEIDLNRAGIRTYFNDQLVQQSDLSHLIFSIPRLIAEISTFTELNAGDVILTGTPGGVGFRRDPQLFIRDGDELRVEIDGIGSIANRAQLEP